MNKFKYLSLVALTMLLSACGSGGGDDCDGTVTGSCGAGGAGGDPVPTTIQLTVSSPTLQSDQVGDNFVTITAFVRDQNNNVMPGETVTFFSLEPASLVPVDNGVTNAAGLAQALLSALGDLTNRTITVTAQVGTSGPSSTIDVDVVGTTLSLEGPTGLPLSDTATYSLLLRDGENIGIPNTAITIDSLAGNTLSSGTVITGSDGEATFDLTATVTGGDTVTVSALGETLTLALNVTENVFSFTSPAPATEIELSPTTQVLTLEWSDGGLSVQDTSVVEFVTNRGDLNGGSLPVQINTVGGVASVTINSDFAGATTITATGLVKDGVVLTDSPSTTLSIEFIATTATTLNVSAFPTTVGINEQTPITAKLYDANGNPVKNKAVLFNITQDPSGGSINPAQVFSDSQGVATSFFQAGGTTTSSNAVEITVNVPDDGLSSSVQLTVALQARNFAIGTGNTLFELTETRYGMPWNITMTDVGGVPVVNSPLQLKLKSINYGKGYWAVVSDPILGLIWAKGAPLYTCDDEDTVVENNSLDTGEDFNGNGTLEAGNIAAIVPLPCDQVTSADITDTQEQVLFTDGAGSVEICVVYGQEYGTWLTTQLTAIAPIQDGTEFSGSRTFLLPVLADDVDDTDEDPPGTRELGFGGVLSPFGRSDCTVGTWP